jgi:hypothetical protein
MKIRTRSFIAAILFGIVAPVAAPQAPAPAAPSPAAASDQVAAVKQSLQSSMAALRQYEWVETTVVSLKGEEKSRKQSSCYYGADGKVQKTPIGAEPATAAKQPRGLRGKIVENKKEELSASMKEAIELVKQYVPPDSARIQAAKDAGRLSVVPPDAQGIAKLVIKDYLKAGDSLTLSVNAATSRIAGVTVATFTDSAKDAVGMKVGFGAFPDGTVYPATINLDVKAQNLAVAIENSGYKKRGG